jgi:hypothetical protein
MWSPLAQTKLTALTQSFGSAVSTPLSLKLAMPTTLAEPIRYKIGQIPNLSCTNL